MATTSDAPRSLVDQVGTSANTVNGDNDKGNATSDTVDVKNDAGVAQDASGRAGVEAQRDNDGHAYWNVNEGGKKRVIVKRFKGRMFVDLRNYYFDASGTLKPTQKGIMLTLTEWDTIKGLVGKIDDQLAEK